MDFWVEIKQHLWTPRIRAWDERLPRLMKTTGCLRQMGGMWPQNPLVKPMLTNVLDNSSVPKPILTNPLLSTKCIYVAVTNTEQSRSAAGRPTASAFFTFGVDGRGEPPNPIMLPIMSNRGLPCLGILIPKYVSPICANASSHIPTSLICGA